MKVSENALKTTLQNQNTSGAKFIEWIWDSAFTPPPPTPPISTTLKYARELDCKMGT